MLHVTEADTHGHGQQESKNDNAMLIERTQNEIIFRFPKGMDLDDLQDLTDFFEYKEMARKSKATQKDVDGLVKAVKKGRWEKTRQQLG